MDSEGLINVCQAVAHGNLRMVRNVKTNQQGTVINMANSGFTVIAEKDPEVWAYEDCEEQNTG